MTPKNLKSWDYIKDRGSVIVKIANQESYYYQFNNGIYSPVIEKVYFDMMPEKQNIEPHEEDNRK
jgi:hypothetical protein